MNNGISLLRASHGMSFRPGAIIILDNGTFLTFLSMKLLRWRFWDFSFLVAEFSSLSLTHESALQALVRRTCDTVTTSHIIIGERNCLSTRFSLPMYEYIPTSCVSVNIVFEKKLSHESHDECRTSWSSFDIQKMWMKRTPLSFTYSWRERASERCVCDFCRIYIFLISLRADLLSAGRVCLNEFLHWERFSCKIVELRVVRTLTGWSSCARERVMFCEIESI